VRVDSPVGRFPYEPERLRVAGRRIVLEGRMGAWPASVELEPRDALALVRAASRPLAAAAVVAAAGVALRAWRRG
jgi:hypothetical protein